MKLFKIFLISFLLFFALAAIALLYFDQFYSVSSLVDLSDSLKKIGFNASSTVRQTIDENTIKDGEFTGFYQSLQTTDEGGPCDFLVVQSGDKELTDYFSQMVDYGNTINSKNDYGQLMLDVNLSDIGGADRAKILNSTSNSPVTVTMQKQAQQGMGASGCYSFFRIIKVK